MGIKSEYGHIKKTYLSWHNSILTLLLMFQKRETERWASEKTKNKMRQKKIKLNNIMELWTWIEFTAGNDWKQDFKKAKKKKNVLNIVDTATNFGIVCYSTFVEESKATYQRLVVMKMKCFMRWKWKNTYFSVYAVLVLIVPTRTPCSQKKKRG